ncbi:MAG: PAS domain S-box protein [Deltaproteobacteria bacterium]|nr:PAS domain S-box protein [Deltaproteobacteria bacterium]
MDSRWQAICTVGIIVVFLSAFHLYQTITLQRNNLRETIALEQNLHDMLARNITEQTLASYLRRIETFSRVRTDIIAAFAGRDREKLLALSRPYYESLRREDEAFYIFLFALPDNRAFLRVHQPGLHDDDLSAIRPIVKAVNASRQQQSGFEAGKYGLFYRVTQPLFFDGEYIGCLEFGISLDPLLAKLRQGSNHEVALLVNEEHLRKASQVKQEQEKRCGPAVLLPQGSELFARIAADPRLDCTPDAAQLEVDGRVYQLSRDLPLNDYQGKAIGRLIIAHDFTGHQEKLGKIIRISVATTIALLLLVFTFLYFSIGRLLTRILNLNRSLQQVNDGLEDTVKKRTAELEQEINERKLVNHELALEIEQRQEAEEKLATEKELLAVTLRSIGDGVISTDLEGRIILLNDNAEKLTGWSQQEAGGRSLADIFRLIDEPSGAPHENLVADIVKNGASRTLDQLTVLIARDGSRKNIAACAAPIYDRDNRSIGFIVVFRDVTAQKRLEEEMLKVRNLESVGIFAGGIAHDFNNLLSTILGNINLATIMIGPGQDAHELLRTAETASLMARDLTRQLLTFARGHTPVRQTAAIAGLIEEAAAFILSGSKVKYTCNFAPGLWPVDIDPGQMSQVIRDIVLNASQAMDGKGAITIDAENIGGSACGEYALPAADYVKINIRDTGKGIETQNLPRIFDPYFTTREKNSEKGSGLGLAIVHSIITQHDGFIRVASQPGAGTTFTIFLPAAGG